MNRDPQGCLIWGILIACAVSGFISGQIVAQDFRSMFSSSGWGLYAGPGIIFGVLFSLTVAGTYLWKKDREIFGPIVFVFLFTIASTIIYFIAVQIAMRILIVNQGNSNAFVAGGSAGLFGAGTLSLAAKLLSGTRIDCRDELLTTLVGTVAGVIFFLSGGGSLEEMSWSLHFVIWQVVVGWSLSRSIRKGIAASNNLAKNMQQSHNGEVA